MSACGGTNQTLDFLNYHSACELSGDLVKGQSTCLVSPQVRPNATGPRTH